MPLIRKTGTSVPKELGLFFPMLTPEGTTIDVFVYASALPSLDTDPVGPVGLLKRHRTLLEAIASDKHDRTGAGGDGILQITIDDLLARQAGNEVVGRDGDT